MYLPLAFHIFLLWICHSSIHSPLGLAKAHPFHLPSHHSNILPAPSTLGTPSIPWILFLSTVCKMRAGHVSESPEEACVMRKSLSENMILHLEQAEKIHNYCLCKTEDWKKTWENSPSLVIIQGLIKSGVGVTICVYEKKRFKEKVLRSKAMCTFLSHAHAFASNILLSALGLLGTCPPHSSAKSVTPLCSHMLCFHL